MAKTEYTVLVYKFKKSQPVLLYVCNFANKLDAKEAYCRALQKYGRPFTRVEMSKVIWKE